MNTTTLITVAVAAELAMSWVVPGAGLLVVLTVVGAATRLPDQPAAVPARQQPGGDL